jgi:hypothetical protein
LAPPSVVPEPELMWLLIEFAMDNGETFRVTRSFEGEGRPQRSAHLARVLVDREGPAALRPRSTLDPDGGAPSVSSHGAVA